MMKILWDLKCPVHAIPLLAKDEIFAYCPMCQVSYFQHELRNPRRRQNLIEKIQKEGLHEFGRVGEID
ncbi:MAG: hypothetical protein ACTSRP_12440 [Candidatus Helarchaeota archaeon]